MEELTDQEFESSNSITVHAEISKLMRLKDMLVQLPVEINLGNIVVLRKGIVLGVS